MHKKYNTFKKYKKMKVMGFAKPLKIIGVSKPESNGDLKNS